MGRSRDIEQRERERGGKFDVSTITVSLDTVQRTQQVIEIRNVTYMTFRSLKL